MIVRCQGNRVIVEQATVEALRALRSRLSLPNPRYDGAVRAGKTPIGIPRMLHYFTGDGDRLVLPGACAGLAARAAELAGEQWSLDSDLLEHRPIHLDFTGDLRLYQVLATADLTRYDHGVLHAPTGSGKTIMALSIIAERAQPTLVVVHSRVLQDQWVRACHQWYRGKAAGDIGTVGGSDWGPGRCITVGVVNTAANRLDDLSRYGHIVIDECHRAAATTYRAVLDHARARYRTGLSATPWRRDGLGEAVKFQLGRLVEVERGPLVESGALLPINVIQIPTAFKTQRNASEEYQAVLGDLVVDSDRNALIADRVCAQGGVVLVLSDRVEHCETLARLCGGIPLHGQQLAGARRTADEAIQTARDGRPVVLCATTQLIGEGFDLPAADTLAIATPIKFDGRLIQALGRVLRPSPGKTSGRILDFCDWAVGVLSAGAKARAKVYRNIKREESCD